MAIPQARVDIATDQYIASNFNASRAYMAAHPNSTMETAYGNGTAFIDLHGIREKAFEKIKNDKKLSLPAVLNSFTESLEASNGVYFKGEKIADEPQHPTRLQARMFLAKEVYGIGQEQVNIDNRQVNVSVQALDTDKLSGLIEKLSSLAIVSQDHSSRRAIAIEE